MFGHARTMMVMSSAQMGRQYKQKLLMVQLHDITEFTKKVVKPAQTTQHLSFAWTRGFAHKVKLDDNPRLLDFTKKLEAACIGAVESGKMTKDLALIIHGSK